MKSSPPVWGVMAALPQELGVPFGVIRSISDTAAPLASRVLAELFPTSQSAG